MIDPARLRILKTLDVGAALPGFQAMGFRPSHDAEGRPTSERTVCLAGLYKARLLLRQGFNRVERQTLLDWLLANGFEVPGDDA